MIQLVIGKRYSTEDLAFYNEGDLFPNVIVANVNTSIDSVLLPVLSDKQNDHCKVKNMTRRAITVGCYIIMPMMLGLFAIAPDVVSLVLTDKWIECVPYLRVFCLTYMLWPIHTANLNVVKAEGRSDIFLRQEIAKTLAGVAILIVTVPYGIMTVVYGFIASSIISLAINCWPNGKLIGYSFSNQMKDVFPILFLSLLMSGFLFVFSNIGCSRLLKVCIQIIVGIGFYWGGSHLLKLEPYIYIMNLLKRRKEHHE